VFFGDTGVLFRSKTQAAFVCRVDVLMPPFPLPPPKFCINTEQDQHRLLSVDKKRVAPIKHNKNYVGPDLHEQCRPTPPTDIRGTLTCRHTALTTFEFVICTHVKILLGNDIQSTRSILADCFKLAKTMSLLLVFFEVGAVTVSR
jgi:hypothetical protein